MTWGPSLAGWPLPWPNPGSATGLRWAWAVGGLIPGFDMGPIWADHILCGTAGLRWAWTVGGLISGLNMGPRLAALIIFVLYFTQ